MHSPSRSRRRWSVVSAIVFLTALLPLQRAQSQATRVTSVDVAGNQKINKETILAVVSTKPGDEYSAERVERDRRSVESLGWFKVVGPPAVQQVPGGVRILFVVTEWPLLKSIQIAGNTVVSEEQIRGVIKTKTEQVFNLAQWQNDVAAIEDLYKQKSYVAQALDNIDTPEFADTGILKVQVMELTIEAVKINGLHKTKTYVVMRVLKQREGKLYNTAQMSKDYQELRKLDFFDSINSKVEVSQPGKVVVTWELKEKRTGQASVGLGYSPAESLIGRAEIAENNLFGRGQRLSLAGEIGAIAGPSFELSFNEPWLTQNHTSLGIDVYDKVIYRFNQTLGQVQGSTSTLDRYFERRIGGMITIGQPFKLPITVGFRHELVDTSNLPSTLDFPRQDGTIDALSFRYVRNTSDYPQYPTKGLLGFITLEPGYAQINPGPTPLQSFGNQFYAKGVIDLRKYIALRRNNATKEPERERASQKIPVIAMRMMAGTAVGNLPFFEQFFLGGSQSLRGYLEDRFWGQNVLLGSIEYRRPLANRITGVLFSDVGDAWGANSAFQFTNKQLRTDFQQSESFRLFPSVGVGLRVATPIGPVRLDYGYGLQGGRIAFSIGQSF